MKHYSRFITLGFGLFSFFCFALPWKHNFSGAVLANGKGWSITFAFIVALGILGSGLYMLKRKTQGNSRNIPIALGLAGLGIAGCTLTVIEVLNTTLNIITISFLASLVIIGATIIMIRQQSPQESVLTLVVLISSVVGFCCFLLLLFGGNLSINSRVRLDNTRYGAFLTAIGYILVFVSHYCLSITENSPESHQKQENEKQDSEGYEE